MSALQTQPLEVNDFSLGITDYFIDGAPQAAQKLDNLLLTPNAKPRTRWGSEAVNDQLPLGLFRVNKLEALNDDLFAFQDKRCYLKDGVNWTEIVGPASGTFLPAGDSNSIITSSEWQGHLFFTSSNFISPQKLFRDGTYKVVNAGLPSVPAGFSVTNPAGAGESYLYAAVLKYSYDVDTITFLDRGPVYFYPTAVTGGAITGGNTTTVTLPTTYSPVENHDTTNWVIEVYRTTTAGDVFYKIDEVAFGTVSIVDDTEDADLVLNEQLYTTGDSQSNDPAPKAKYVHIVNDYGYWAHISEDSEILKNEVRQSKAGDPDSVPSSFFATTEQDITGLSSIYDRPLVFCTEYIYRIDNFFGDDGSGGMLLRRIDDKAGCVSQNSIVRTHLGIFWAGKTGFYWSDGFRVASVSDHLNETYKKLILNTTRQARISGTFDSSNQRVIWGICLEEGSNEPDTMLVLDLKFPFLPSGERRGGTFMTMSGGDSFRPTYTLMIGNSLYRGDTRGYVLEHSISYFTDPKIDAAELVADWDEQVIQHTYWSCFLDFGSKFYRKWVPRILVSADNTTNLSLAIESSNDNNRIVGSLKPIRYRANITWGDSLPLWGDPSALWNSQGLIEEWRRFPAGGLRCNYKQIRFTNAVVNIVDSSLLGTATVDPGANTATLGGSFNWLEGITDYFIAFEHDGYQAEFKILSRTPTTVIYEDLSGTDPSALGNYNWIIRGMPKGEVLLLNGYVIHWAYISKSHTPFSSSSLGGTP